MTTTHTPTPRKSFAVRCAFMKPNGEQCKCAKWNYSEKFCKAHNRAKVQS